VSEIIKGKFTRLDKAENLDQVFEAFDAEGLMRNRPYLGQAHTTSGERGKQEVSGVTMRDIQDCLFLAILDASGCTIPDYKMTINDVYAADLSKIDIMAVAQNMGCRIEKLMGIYPNIIMPEVKGE